jgi:hypothetical protein
MKKIENVPPFTADIAAVEKLQKINDPGALPRNRVPAHQQGSGQWSHAPVPKSQISQSMKQK